MKDEPTEMENDLAERIIGAAKRCEIALLLIEKERQDLVPTVLEDLYYGVHLILEKYCIKELSA